MRTRAFVATGVITGGAAVLALMMGFAEPMKKIDPSAAVPSSATADTPDSEEKKGDKLAQVKIEQLAFLAGSRRADMKGTMAEEIWSRPLGSSMMGCFRWVNKGGVPIVIEMLTISEENGVISMRIRHHDAQLNAKEDKDKPITLTLSKLEGTRAEFSAGKNAGDIEKITYHLNDEVMQTTVQFKSANAKPRVPLVFEFTTSGKAEKTK